MAIEHNAIPQGEIHEPKGIGAAASNTVYVANGGGSGTWTTVPSGLDNIVFVNSESDFPAPSGGVITLAANTTYILGANITTSNRFVAADNSKIMGMSFFAPRLTYTGSGDMFTGVDVNFEIGPIAITAASAQLFNFSETGSGGLKLFQADTVVVSQCAKWGTYNNLQSVLIVNSSCPNAGDGISLLGTASVVISVRQFALISTSVTFTGIDFDAAVFDTVELRDLLFIAPSGAIGLSGLANNANISSGFIATVEGGTFNGGMTPLNGITTDDFRWRFSANQGIADTMPGAMLAVVGNATATTIAATNTPVKVNATFTTVEQSHFTADSTGRITYNGERPLTIDVDAVLSMAPSSGTNQTMRAFIAVNGSVINNSRKAVFADSGAYVNNTLIWRIDIMTGDYFEVWVTNQSTVTDVIVQDMTLRVTG